jgi:hypothetical protein
LCSGTTIKPAAAAMSSAAPSTIAVYARPRHRVTAALSSMKSFA